MKKIHMILNLVLRRIYALLDMLGAPTAATRWPLPKQLAELSPEDAGLVYLEVDIDTELGACPAWWVPAFDGQSELEADKWVIFVHGRGGERVGALDMIPEMHAMGFNSLVITYRNDWVAPKSPDGRDHLGATEWRDLEAAVKFASNAGAKHITIFARSAGAAITGQFLSRSMDAYLVDSLIFDNPVLNWEPVFLNAAPSWLPRWVGRLIVWGNMRLIGARTKQFNLVDEPPLRRPPMLLLHSADDDVCPVRVSERFVEERPESWAVVFIKFPSGGHAGARFEDADTYLDVVWAWLAPGALAKRDAQARELLTGETVQEVSA